MTGKRSERFIDHRPPVFDQGPRAVAFCPRNGFQFDGSEKLDPSAPDPCNRNGHLVSRDPKGRTAVPAVSLATA